MSVSTLEVLRKKIGWSW